MQLRNGESLSGVYLSGSNDGSEWSVTLCDVQSQETSSAPGAPNQSVYASKQSFSGRDVSSLSVEGVTFGGRLGSSEGATASFDTDADIPKGRRGELFGRELQRWQPDAEGIDLASPGLESPAQAKASRWDQFEANKRQFGVQTSFNEDMYTTKLDKSKARISEREAAKIATEIERKRAGTMHQLEERGQIDYREADEDEEARYSAVLREQPSGPEPPFDMASQNGKKAWTNAAGSVAAVSGRPSNASAPIDVDPRKEHNKVRLQLAGKSGSTSRDRSPYGTPKGNRSLVSPLVGNAAQVEALDLNPGIARFGAGVRTEFAKFKKASRHEDGSPTDSELAKELSASASIKSGSAPSTPEDGTLAEGPKSATLAPHTSLEGLQDSDREQPALSQSAHALRGLRAGGPSDLLHMQPQAAQGAQEYRSGPNGHTPISRDAPVSGLVPGNSAAAGQYPPPQQDASSYHMAGVFPHNQPMMSIPGQPYVPMHVQGGPGHGMPAAGSRPLSFGAPMPVMSRPGAVEPSAPFGQQRPQRPPVRSPTPQGKAPPIGPTAARPATSKLNPDAKEFKLNPDAKTFTPGAAPMSRASSATSSAAHGSSVMPPAGGPSATGAPPTRAPGPRPPSMSRQPSGQMERGTSRDLAGARMQSHSPPQGAGPRYRPGPAPRPSPAPFQVAPQNLGPQQHFVQATHAYQMPYMQGSPPMYMANGQGMLSYAVFPPAASGYPRQGYPATMMYGGMPMQMGGGMPGARPQQ